MYVRMCSSLRAQANVQPFGWVLLNTRTISARIVLRLSTYISTKWSIVMKEWRMLLILLVWIKNPHSAMIGSPSIVDWLLHTYSVRYCNGVGESPRPEQPKPAPRGRMGNRWTIATCRKIMPPYCIQKYVPLCSPSPSGSHRAARHLSLWNISPFCHIPCSDSFPLLLLCFHSFLSSTTQYAIASFRRPSPYFRSCAPHTPGLSVHTGFAALTTLYQY